MLLQIPMIPGIDQYLQEGIQKLGDTISLFTQTDRKTERAIRNMLLENPDLVPKFADLEARMPGTLESMGFGKFADVIGSIGPSQDLKREQALGDRTIALEGQELGFKEFANNLVIEELMRDPTMSALQVGAMISQRLGIPRNAELIVEDLSILPAELQAQRATMIMNAADKGEKVEGSISDYVELFRAGKDDPEVTGALISHPVTGPQFAYLMELFDFRENAETQRELASMRRTAGGLPAAVVGQINMAGDILSNISEVERLLQQFPEGVGKKYFANEFVNSSLDSLIPGVSQEEAFGRRQLRAAIAGVNSAIFHLRSGTAVSRNERNRLEPLTPNKTDPAESIYPKLVELNRFFQEYRLRRQAIGNGLSTVGAVDDPLSAITTLTDMWLSEGVSPQEIAERIEIIIGQQEQQEEER